MTEDNADDLRVGVISNAYYNEKDGWYWCEGVIWDETAQNLITDKNWSVSCSYDFLEENDEGGTENNIPYDREFTKLNFVHLALVDNPRYERANIVFNSKMVENWNPNQKRNKLGQWTKEDYNAEIDKYMRGEYKTADRIKVVEHPSQPWLNSGLQDAEMYLTGATYDKSTKGKHNVSEETMRNLPDLINNPQYIFKSSTVPGSYVGVLDDFEEENGIKKPLIAAIKPEGGKFAVNLIPSIYGKDPDFPYREVFKNNLLYERTENNKTVSNNIVASIATETLKRSNNSINDNQKDFNPIGEKMLNNIENENWKTLYDKNGEPYHVDFDDAKDDEIKTKKTTIKRKNGKEEEIEYLDNPPKGWKKNEGATTAPLGYNWYTNGKSILSGERKSILVKDHSKIYNAKEQEMALLEELKKLINTVENDKGENMVDNEKTDKRKLIDEIGGILKGKVDEELWRTIIGKAEKNCL